LEHVYRHAGEITVTPGPYRAYRPETSFPSPFISVTWPTFTPWTSVIAFHLPGTKYPDIDSDVPGTGPALFMFPPPLLQI